jgi:hypothetical protein
VDEGRVVDVGLPIGGRVSVGREVGRDVADGLLVVDGTGGASLEVDNRVDADVGTREAELEDGGNVGLDLDTVDVVRMDDLDDGRGALGFDVGPGGVSLEVDPKGGVEIVNDRDDVDLVDGRCGLGLVLSPGGGGTAVVLGGPGTSVEFPGREESVGLDVEMGDNGRRVELLGGMGSGGSETLGNGMPVGNRVGIEGKDNEGNGGFDEVTAGTDMFSEVGKTDVLLNIAVGIIQTEEREMVAMGVDDMLTGNEEIKGTDTVDRLSVGTGNVTKVVDFGPVVSDETGLVGSGGSALDGSMRVTLTLIGGMIDGLGAVGNGMVGRGESVERRGGDAVTEGSGIDGRLGKPTETEDIDITGMLRLGIAVGRPTEIDSPLEAVEERLLEGLGMPEGRDQVMFCAFVALSSPKATTVAGRSMIGLCLLNSLTARTKVLQLP